MRTGGVTNKGNLVIADSGVHEIRHSGGSIKLTEPPLLFCLVYRLAPAKGQPDQKQECAHEQQHGKLQDAHYDHAYGTHGHPSLRFMRCYHMPRGLCSGVRAFLRAFLFVLLERKWFPREL